MKRRLITAAVTMSAVFALSAAGTLTVQHPGALGTSTTGTTIRSNRDQATGGTTTLNFNITTASTAAAPNLFAEPLTLISELSNDLRAGLATAATNQSLRLTGGSVGARAEGKRTGKQHGHQEKEGTNRHHG